MKDYECEGSNQLGIAFIRRKARLLSVLFPAPTPHLLPPPPSKHAHLVLDRVPVKNVKRTALGVDVNQQRIKLLALLEGPYLVL